MSEIIKTYDIVKIVGRLKKSVEKIRKAIDSGDPKELAEILKQYGANEQDAEEFATMVVMSVKESSNVELLKKNITEFMSKRGAKKDEIEDVLDGLTTIIETVLKEVVKK